MKRAFVLVSVLAVAFIIASGLTDKAKVTEKATRLCNFTFAINSVR
ncbi:MAG: hypothetical protein GZ094_23790 [Mariniphaga sp.]|nr:hypothetical protein [Mariniphaga sp.]